MLKKRAELTVSEPFLKYACQFCGYIYDEKVGDPEHGLSPGTRWADVPDDWGCPDCGVTKSDFAPCES
jgi:rubredoxin-NAD+ reductase